MAQQWQSPQPPKSKRSGCLTAVVIVGGILLVTGIIGAIGGNDEQSTTTTTTVRDEPATTKEAAPQADAQAQLACDHYRNVADDIAGGVLTAEQVTTKLQEVYDTANRSEVPGIGDASRDLLAAWNRADVDALGAAATRLRAACAKVGH